MDKKESYLDIAKRDLRQANILFKYRSDDEGDLNNVGYLIQQAVEKALKHYIEYNNMTLLFTHDIDDLLDIAGADKFPEVKNRATTLTNFEDKTRYVKNYRLTLRVVDECLKIANDTVNEIDVLTSVIKDAPKSDERYLKVFPCYDDVIEIPQGWEDTTVLEDEVPSISINNENGDVVKLLIDYKSQSLRHPPRSSRYIMFKNGKFVKAGNDFDAMIELGYEKIN